MKNTLLIMLTSIGVSIAFAPTALGQQIFWTESTFSSPSIRKANPAGAFGNTLALPAATLPQGTVYDATRDSLYWVELAFANAHLNISSSSPGAAHAATNGGASFRDIALDPAGGKVYWTASNLVLGSRIYRANLDGSGIDTLVAWISNGPEAPRGIALDLTAGKMYWTDFGLGKIRRANLDGSSIEDVLSNLNGPVGIRLNTTSGFMYWSEGNAGSLRRASLAGTSVQTLVTTTGIPNYLALDTAGGKIYWTEIGVPRIRRADLDGQNPEALPLAVSDPAGIWIRPAAAQVYVDQSYTPLNAGGHSYGFDAFATVHDGVDNVAASGTVNIHPFTYDETAVVNKNLTLAGSGVPTIQNLQLTGGKIITMGGDLQVSNGLTLTSGTIRLGQSNLIIGASAFISGGSVSNYIVTDGAGALVRKGLGLTSELFPIGAKKADGTTSYNPATLSNAGTADDFSVKVKDKWDHAIADTTIVVKRQWTIAEGTPGGSNVTLTFQWNNNTDVTIPIATPRIGHWVPDTWEQTTATLQVVVDPEVTATASGFTSFSDYSVGEAGGLPIQLSSFAGETIAGQGVQLKWATRSEINSYGFFVQRRKDSDSTFVELQGSFIAGHGTTTVPQQYSYIDGTATQGTWFYRLRQVDLDGSGRLTESISVIVTPGAAAEIPSQFTLDQNYPNPFNPSTTIRYGLPQASPVTLTIFDLLGNTVANIVAGVQVAGYHEVHYDASALASGVYFYRVQAGDFVKTMRFLLLR